jgi:hypothetical protein
MSDVDQQIAKDKLNPQNTPTQDQLIAKDKQNPQNNPAAFDPTGKSPEEIQDARNKGLVDESAYELARWLKIARGR